MKNYKFKMIKWPLLALLFGLWTVDCGLTTPFFIQSFQSDGTAQTNPMYMSQYPATSAPFSIYGTNIIWGGFVLKVTNNVNGYGSNWIFPGTYRCVISNLNVSFIVNIPDTTNFNTLALYVQNLPSFAAPSLSTYGVITNQLGFPPATNSPIGILFALNFQPATNGGPLAYSQLPFTPPTNSYSGLTNVLGFPPATNNNAGMVFALGFAPATNSNAGMVFALGFTPLTNSFTAITTTLGYKPATNTTAGIIAALGYTPGTNDGNIGLLASAVASASTNGFTVWVSYKTNDVPGPAFTNLPPGSIMTTTNGAFFVLSNLVWNPK